LPAKATQTLSQEKKHQYNSKGIINDKTKTSVLILEESKSQESTIIW
jgi:hypothetical protein